MLFPYHPGQFHRCIDALDLLPFSLFSATGPILAQNESLRPPPSGCGAFKFDPVSRLYLARPFAVKPAPCFAGSFSPRPIAKDGFFAMITSKTLTSCRHLSFWLFGRIV
jgi:hypothetical protein